MSSVEMPGDQVEPARSSFGSARVVVRPSARVVTLLKAAVAFGMCLVCIGLVVEGSEQISDDSDTWISALKIVGGVLAAPFAFWVGFSMLRAVFAARARIDVTRDGMVVHHRGIFRRPIEIDRSKVAAISFDIRTARLKRFRDHPRFPLAGEPHPKGPPWLFSKVGGAPFPVLSHVRSEVPNAAIAFTEPLRLESTRRWMKLFPAAASLHPPIHGRRSRGLLVRFKDPAKAEEIFSNWGVVDPIAASDLERTAPDEKARCNVRRLALMDNSLIVVIFVGLFVIPVLMAPPFEGPLLSPGIGVCRQVDDALAQNPAPDQPAEAPPLLQEMIPGEIESDGFFLVDGGAVHPSDDAGDQYSRRLLNEDFQRGYYWRWSGPAGDVIVEIVELGDDGHAANYAEDSLDETCAEANEAFDVAEIPGAVGMRWFSERGLLDQVTFGRDEYFVWVAVTSPDDEPDRRRAVRLAKSLAAGFE